MNVAASTQTRTTALAPGETARWTGHPPATVRFRRADVFLVPVSLLWGGFAFFWEGTAITMHAPLLFRLWGVPFVIVGLYFILGRFFIDAWLRSKTRYLVSDRAAYVVRDGPFAATRRFAGTALDTVTVENVNGAIGTIRFPAAQPMFYGGYGFRMWNGASLDAFESIPYEPAYAALLAIRNTA